MKEHVMQEKNPSNVGAKDWKLAFQKKTVRRIKQKLNSNLSFSMFKNTFSLVPRS